jgi:NADH:ubiquinone reductase (H+-translocating)
MTKCPLPTASRVIQPHVVIIGGGFGGLAAARALKDAAVRITLIDRRNHHLFQPLLYQVATATLPPGHIAAPIRGLLKEQNNVTVVLGEVTGIYAKHSTVIVALPGGGKSLFMYDYVVVATGAEHSYFGRNEFAHHAPGMKTLADALTIRQKILNAFEQAEAEGPMASEGRLTFVLVGAGPTGVEIAGALAMLTRKTLKSSFRKIDPGAARIVLVDQAQRILGAFEEALSEKARKHLEELGVEVRLGHGIEQIDEDGVVLGGERIASKTVIWTAGVAASPVGKWLNAETDRAGRVRIQNDLTVAGQKNIFVLGDTASLDQNGRPLPGVAQVAMQQGNYAGRLIGRRIAGKKDLPPFRYFDKGNMAVVAGQFAIVQSGKFKLSGLFGWLPWAAIHIAYLPLSNLRLSVLMQWVWTHVAGIRSSLLISQRSNHCEHNSAPERLKTSA